MNSSEPESQTLSDPLQAITHICNVKQSVYGIHYLKEIMRRFAELYQFDYALLGQPSGAKGELVQTKLLLAHGTFQENISYELDGTPCEHVLGGDQICLHDRDVTLAFPRDALLQEMGVSSYVGSRLLSPEGDLLGLLAFMSERPIVLGDGLCTVLDFVSSRAGMELERENLNRQSQDRAREENRQIRLASLGQLVNGVAHDFNNLLAGIMGHAELLELKLKNNEEARPHVEGVLRSATRAKHITRQLLDFAQPQANHHEVTDVAQVIEELQQLVVPTFNSNIKFETQLPAEPLIAKIDGSHLQQVLLNLMLNAKDAMPDGGILKISAAIAPVESVNQTIGPEYPHNIRFIVADIGTGIDTENMNHIFDPFFTTKEVGKGTGMGLASVHSIVQTYGGVVTVDSAPGEGTSFTVLLTAADSLVDPMPTESSRPSSQKRLLLAEDDEAIATTVSEFLTLRGYTVLVARDGLEAYQLVNQFNGSAEAFDLIIADLNMPKMSGKELLDHVASSSPKTGFIIATGDPSRLDVKAIEQSAGHAVMMKPFSLASLVKKVSEILVR
ncbi:MAG: signal transduction histidine kinase [Candidatus Azotimanducaceae bacterium]|jgi:signal transduction histidine kinase